MAGNQLPNLRKERIKAERSRTHCLSFWKRIIWALNRLENTSCNHLFQRLFSLCITLHLLSLGKKRRHLCLLQGVYTLSFSCRQWSLQWSHFRECHVFSFLLGQETQDYILVLCICQCIPSERFARLACPGVTTRALQEGTEVLNDVATSARDLSEQLHLEMRSIFGAVSSFSLKPEAYSGEERGVNYKLSI